MITFDYRDVGGSRTVPLRTSTARMADWGRRDIDAVLRHASARTGGRLLYVGHSAGGQLLGLAGSADRVDRIVTVASQNGYWLAASAPERYRLGALWHLVFPTALWVAGYLPGRWLGLGNDLSPGIARDWIRWCRDPEYLSGDPEVDPTSYGRVRAPIRAVRVSDDPWATRSAVADLHRRYARCPVDHVAITPTGGATRSGTAACSGPAPGRRTGPASPTGCSMVADTALPPTPNRQIRPPNEKGPTWRSPTPAPSPPPSGACGS